MKLLIKHGLLLFLTGLCLLAIGFCAFPSLAKESIGELKKKSESMQSELSGVNAELAQKATKIADVETEIEDTENEIDQIQETLTIATAKEEKQYEAMKIRIKYMYENNDVSMFAMLCDAQSMQEFLNTSDFIQNVSEYDRQQLSELLELQSAIKEQNEELQTQKQELVAKKKELKAERKELKAKAEEMSVDLDELNDKIVKLQEEERKRREEEARKAAEAARIAAEEAAKKAQEAQAEATESGTTVASSSKYNTSGGGVLTKNKGVNYYNGHKETWYSQKVLPGGGLKIPGRHVRSDGVICDENGSVCVANVDFPKGTLIDTSLGMGKVYDTGCAHGVVDIYVNW